VSGPPPNQPQNIATAVTEVSERATLLVREEIELAKAEVTEKMTKLARGVFVGAAAGIFVAMGVVLALEGGAWLLYYFLPGNNFTYFWGFFAMAVILFLLGAIAAMVAARVMKRGAPPTPDMAIEEAKLIRETVQHPEAPPGPYGAPSPVAAPPTATPPPAAGPPPPAATPGGEVPPEGRG
jgi:hypothetical protein